VSVSVASAVGDFHQSLSPTTPTVITPTTLLTRMYVISVKPRGKNTLPVFQSIVSLIMPLTKSTAHSKKFCIPVGFIFKFRLPIKEKIKTMSETTIVIKTFDKLKSSQGIPNALSTIGASCSTLFTSFQAQFFLHSC